MLKHFSIILVLAAIPVALPAAPQREAALQQRVAASTLDERGGWGLLVGLAILGLALRRRRGGPVVTS